MDLDQAKRVMGVGYTPFDAQLEVLESYTTPKFKEVKGADGEMTVVEDAPEEWVRFKTTSLSTMGNEIVMKMTDVHDVGNNDDPSHVPTNILKARRNAILAQLNAKKDGKGSALYDGAIPLEEWGALSQPIIVYLKKGANIHTVQELRDCTESKIATMLPSINPTKLRENARSYLDALSSSEADGRVQAYEARIKDMEDKFNQQNALIEKLLERLDGQSEEPRRRGRPPNAEVAV